MPEFVAHIRTLATDPVASRVLGGSGSSCSGYNAQVGYSVLTSRAKMSGGFTLWPSELLGWPCHCTTAAAPAYSSGMPPPLATRCRAPDSPGSRTKYRHKQHRSLFEARKDGQNLPHCNESMLEVVKQDLVVCITAVRFEMNFRHIIPIRNTAHFLKKKALAGCPFWNEIMADA